jgi:polyisoprenoid-binding protein YceI
MNFTRSRSGLAVCFALLAWLAAVTPAQARDTVVRFDPAQADIRWTLGALLHTVHGTFKLKSGVLTFDPATGAAHGEFVADLSTGNSGDDGRDKTMQQQVLESAKYPLASYVANATHVDARSQGMQTIATTGTFNIHGGDHPMQINSTLQMSGNEVLITAHFQVPYVAWGLHNPSTFILRVGKVVDVDVTLKGTVET